MPLPPPVAPTLNTNMELVFMDGYCFGGKINGGISFRLLSQSKLLPVPQKKIVSYIFQVINCWYGRQIRNRMTAAAVYIQSENYSGRA